MSPEVRWIIGVGVTLGLGLSALIVTQNASLRADIQADISSIRADIASLRTDIDGINTTLYDLNTRISRIEGGLFGFDDPIEPIEQNPNSEARSDPSE